MARAGVRHEELLPHQGAPVDSTRLQFVAGNFAEPGDVGELKRCVALKFIGRRAHARRDDLTIGTGTQLVRLSDSAAVDTGLERVSLELFVPGE